MPLISIVMATYNQEDFVGRSIQSVLDQTFQDFELIVINDGSKDHTGEVVRSYKDPRITYIEQKNQGPNVTYNRGICAAKGDFICFLPGDDLYFPDKLAKQYEYICQVDCDIAFSWVEFIDEQDNPIKGEHFASQYFNHPERTQAETYRWFFLKGNYLSLTTIIARRQLFEEVGLFQTTAIQLSDFDYYIRLVKRGPLPIMQERLVKYRIRSNEQNVSSLGNSVRIYFENHQISQYFFDNVSEKLFREAFADLLLDKDFQGSEQFELEKAFLYLKNDVLWVKSIGAEKLFTLLQDPKLLNLAETKYDFGLPEYYGLTNSLDVTNSKSYRESLQLVSILQNQVEQLRNLNDSQSAELNTLRQDFVRASTDLEALKATLTVRLGRFAGRIFEKAVELFPGQAIQGNVDQVEFTDTGRLQINGWLSCRIGVVSRVELYLGANYLGNVTYGLDRPDVLRFFWRKNRWCGYTGEWELNLQDQLSSNLPLKMRIIDNKGREYDRTITTIHLLK